MIGRAADLASRACRAADSLSVTRSIVGSAWLLGAVARARGVRYGAREVEWLAQDGVREDELEPWAREPAELLEDAVRIVARGIVVRSSSRWSAIPWEQVLAVARADGQGFVLVPRRPPAPPWFVVSPAIADRIAASVAERRAARASGYRGSRARAPAPPPEEIRRRVLGRDDVPGAIEVPLGIPRPSLAGPSAVGGVFGATMALQVAVDWGVIAAGITGLAAALLFGGGLHFAMWRRYARRPRILVMTPDAYVAGLDGDAVRAIPWHRVAAFREASVADRPAIEVVDRDGDVVARTEARLFGIDRGVLIALAEAYRARATSELGGASGEA